MTGDSPYLDKDDAAKRQAAAEFESRHLQFDFAVEHARVLCHRRDVQFGNQLAAKDGEGRFHPESPESTQRDLVGRLSRLREHYDGAGIDVAKRFEAMSPTAHSQRAAVEVFREALAGNIERSCELLADVVNYKPSAAIEFCAYLYDLPWLLWRGVRQYETASTERNVSSEHVAETQSRWHEANEEPPPEFKYGPVTGELKNLGAAFKIDPRSVHTKIGKVRWGRKNHRTSYSVYFKTESDYARVRDAMPKSAPNRTKKH